MSKREVPSNIRLDEATIGSLIIDPQAVGRIQFLQPADFHLRKNGWIYEAIQALYNSQEAIDFVTITEELEKRNQLHVVGGAEYLTRLINSVPSALHVGSYARQLVELATRREFIQIASELAKAGYGSDPPEKTITEIGGRLFRAARGRADFRPMPDLVDEHFELVDEYTKHPMPDGVRGIRTGLNAFDIPMGGLNKGNLLIVASRPGTGKSALLAHCALKVALAGANVVFWEGEMTSNEIVGRMASAMSGVGGRKVKSGVLTSEEFEKYTNALGQIRSLHNLKISDKTDIATTELRSIIASMRNVDVVFVDHIRLFGDRDDNEVRRLGRISWNLKQIAKDGHAVVAAAQLSRRSEYRADNRPQLADIRSSGEIEENADGVYGLYRENGDTKLEIIALKCREGEAGKAGIAYFNPQTMRIGNPARIGDE